MEIIQRKLTKKELDSAIEFFFKRPCTISEEFEQWLCATETKFQKFGCPWGFLQICNEGQLLSSVSNTPKKEKEEL